MALDRLKEAVSSGPSRLKGELPCISGEVAFPRVGFRNLLLPFVLLAGGTGCRDTSVEIQGGWDGKQDIQCFTDYSDAFPDEPIGVRDFVSFGAMTDDYDDWPENAYPMGYIDSYSKKALKKARVFLENGTWVLENNIPTEELPTTTTEIHFAGEVLGYKFGSEGTVSEYMADYVSFCEDSSFLVTVYATWDLTGNSDFQIVGRTIRPMENSGEAFTLFHQYTYFYEDFLSAEQVPESEDDTGVEEIESAEDSGEEADKAPAFYENYPNRIMEVRVGQMENDGSLTIHGMWDALEELDHFDMTGFRVY